MSIGYELGIYIERLPLDRPVSEDEVLRCLARGGVVRAKVPNAMSALIDLGHLVRLDDGSFQRHNVVATKQAEAPATLRDDNPEYAAFRAGVLKLVDQRLRELGLIA